MPSPVARMAATLARYSARYEENAERSVRPDESPARYQSETQAVVSKPSEYGGHLEQDSGGQRAAYASAAAPSDSDNDDDDDWSLPSTKEHMTSSDVRAPAPNALGSGHEDHEGSGSHSRHLPAERGAASLAQDSPARQFEQADVVPTQHARQRLNLQSSQAGRRTQVPSAKHWVAFCTSHARPFIHSCVYAFNRIAVLCLRYACLQGVGTSLAFEGFRRKPAG